MSDPDPRSQVDQISPSTSSTLSAPPFPSSMAPMQEHQRQSAILDLVCSPLQPGCSSHPIGPAASPLARPTTPWAPKSKQAILLPATSRTWMLATLMASLFPSLAPAQVSRYLVATLVRLYFLTHVLFPIFAPWLSAISTLQRRPHLR